MEERRGEWKSPSILDVGGIEEVVQVSVGGGKTVIVDGDPGEPMKNAQQDTSS